VFLPRLGTFPSAFRNSKSHFIAEPIKWSVNNLETRWQQDATGGERWNSKQGQARENQYETVGKRVQ